MTGTVVRWLVGGYFCFMLFHAGDGAFLLPRWQKMCYNTSYVQIAYVRYREKQDLNGMLLLRVGNFDTIIFNKFRKAAIETGGLNEKSMENSSEYFIR